MSQTSVLVLPRFDMPFLQETDACDEGIGGVPKLTLRFKDLIGLESDPISIHF